MLLGSRRTVFMNVFSALALFAIVVRGVIPTGYMIKAPDSESAFIEIEVCHGDGKPSSTVRIDLGKPPGEAPADEDESQPKAPCAFATVAAVDISANAVTPIVPNVTIGERVLSQGVRPGRGLASPPPPARAPPSFI